MNKIKFDIQNSEYSNLVIPIIDGKSLISVLKKFELPFAKREGHLELAGDYKGVPINYIESVSDYYLGLKQEQWLDGKTVILDCPCLCVGCWSFVTKINIDGNSIVWTEFEQICRDNWDYSKFDDFTFDKVQYENALKEIVNSFTK